MPELSVGVRDDTVCIVFEDEDRILELPPNNAEVVGSALLDAAKSARTHENRG